MFLSPPSILIKLLKRDVILGRDSFQNSNYKGEGKEEEKRVREE